MAQRHLEIAAELARDMVDENFASFADAYSSRCGQGYMGGTCPCRGLPRSAEQLRCERYDEASWARGGFAVATRARA
jgi:hypothetical protein